MFHVLKSNIVSSSLSGFKFLVLAGMLSGCSVLPGVVDDEVATPKSSSRISSASLETLANDARAAKAQQKPDLPSSKIENGGNSVRPSLPTRYNANAKTPAAQLSGVTADLGADIPLNNTAKGNNTAQIAAQNLIKARKNTPQIDYADRQTAEPAGKYAASNSLAGNPAVGGAKTYRIDGPPAQPDGQNRDANPQGYAYQTAQANSGNYGQPNYGNMTSYPRSPSARVEPQQSMQQTGFMPPDPAPSARPANDPKAVMEAIERLRSRQAVTTARVAQPQIQNGNDTIATASVASSNAVDPLPKGPMTFVQFDKGSTALPPVAQKSIATMLAPHSQSKQAKVYLAVGLGGEGEAYYRLQQANQRAQAVSEQISAQFEVIRRFDPALPNESVRLFVVNSN